MEHYEKKTSKNLKRFIENPDLLKNPFFLELMVIEFFGNWMPLLIHQKHLT